MPIICTFYGIKILMYFHDHNPPHFHVEYGEFVALIEIQSLVVIKGELPNRALNLVKDWASIHTEELLQNWYYCQNDSEKMFKILPLI